MSAIYFQVVQGEKWCYLDTLEREAKSGKMLALLCLQTIVYRQFTVLLLSLFYTFENFQDNPREKQS